VPLFALVTASGVLEKTSAMMIINAALNRVHKPSWLSSNIESEICARFYSQKLPLPAD
jgi:hypothetical protein